VRRLAALPLLLFAAGCGSPGATLRAEPQEALSDAPVTITVTGARPRAPVEVHARAVDADGTVWRSSTTARADGEGRLVLSGNHAMRLLWTLAPRTDPPFFYLPQHRTFGITLSARVRGHLVQRTVTRAIRAAGVHSTMLGVGRDGVYGELFTAAGHARHAGVLVFGGSEGGLSTASIAALLASHGYSSLALAYFHAPGLPQSLRAIPLEYFAKALRILARQPDVDPGKLVVYGVSRGAEASQLLGIHYPQLVHGVVAVVGSNGSACGIPQFHGQQVHCLGPAWTFHGKPIPYSRFGFSPATPYPFHDEKIDGPIFLVCDGLDRFGPSCPMNEAIRDRLLAHRFAHRVTLLEYPRAGHFVGSLVPYWPESFGGNGEGYTPDDNQVARAEAWPKLLRFLGTV
jgi:dienelactone hydrolase